MRKPIKNFEGLYDIDDIGNVYSIERVLTRSNNRQHTVVERRLKQYIDRKGYNYVCLSDMGKMKTKKVHRLVAEAFIPNPENKPQVNHINSNKQDNSIGNLEWVTGKENYAHAKRNGLVSKEFLTGTTKLSRRDRLAIRNIGVINYGDLTYLAKIFDVSTHTIQDIVKNRGVYKNNIHITENH